MKPDDAQLLVCPLCRSTLAVHATCREGLLHDGALCCRRCPRTWPVRDGLPRLVDEAAVRGVDWLMRQIYDRFAALHDPAVRFLLPLLQFSTADALRDGYMQRLELARLRVTGPRSRIAPRRETPSRVPTKTGRDASEADVQQGPRRRNGTGRPLRILEVGVGTGANLPLLERDLPPDLDVELWGCDLSEGMLAQCRRRVASHPGRRMRLVLADAHALPFPDHSFDRVFHVGGIAGYRDPRRGLAEMARVARPGTPIVVVDEQLDPHRPHGPYHRLMFRAITFYTSEPLCPRAEIPPGATDVLEEQLSRFYYCLRFRMPRTAPARQGRRD